MQTLLLDALSCRNDARAPIWLMRQAGRYLPEYRAIREKHSFLEMCHTPELAAAVTLLPINLLEMDAAILFSDILVIPEALGVGLQFKDAEGPIIERPLNFAKDVDSLPKPEEMKSLDYVAEAIRCVLPELKVPLIGFCGAPFTVASYMIEGKTSRDFKKTKQWMLQDPDSFHRLLDHIAACSIRYLNMQIDAGVHALQIFDSWAMVLGSHQFHTFSLPYLKKILKGISNPEIPVILFCRGSSVFAKDLATLEPHGISIDWNADLSDIRKVVPSSIALQGNLDPDILYAPHQVIKSETLRLLKGMRGDRGYIFNLGHGLKPDIPVSSVKTLVEVVKSQS